MKIEKDFVLREIAGDYIIIPTGQTGFEMNGLITVNEIAAFIWNLLQEERTFDALMDAILTEYEIDEQTARNDLQEFLDILQKKGIIAQPNV